MVRIPKLDPDGTEPPEVCRSSREWLVNFYEEPAGLALRYSTDNMAFFSPLKPPRWREEEDATSVAHLRSCPQCIAWLKHVVPAKILRRQQRLSRYCCSKMFCAVEEYRERNLPQVSFIMFRGEDPSWVIDRKSGSFMLFCPWCGQRLPASPFIEDEKA
jgi:hypothetical protein